MLEAKVLLRLIGWMYHRESMWDEADAKAERERDAGARAKLRQAHFTRGLAWLHARVPRLRERVRPKGQAEGVEALFVDFGLRGRSGGNLREQVEGRFETGSF